MKLRLFSKQDLNSILDIQAAAEHAAGWRPSDYERLADDPAGMVLVAVVESEGCSKLLGFAAFRRLGREAELWNIAVRPDQQRHGVGKALLVDGCRRLLEAGAERVFLEVRAANTGALEFYRLAGFNLQGRRKDYYRDPQDDAMVLALELRANLKS